jgi:undecaprenyl-diphosphatase
VADFSCVAEFDRLAVLALKPLGIPWLNSIAWVVASLSTFGFCFWFLAAVLWIWGRRSIARQIALALVIATIMVSAIKLLVHRARPSAVISSLSAINPHDLFTDKFSFPSSHTTLAAAAAFTLLLNYKDWRALIAVLATVIIAATRMYQGMHFPTDILGGVVLGVISSLIARATLRFTHHLLVLESQPSAQEHDQPFQC